MRPYVRPLVVTFSAFGLACLFSYAAIVLTEPDSARPADQADSGTDTAGGQHPALSPEASFAQAKLEAAGGDPEKLLILANYYLIGYGTGRDPAEAARLHKLGAEKGDAFSQSCYGRDLLYGIGGMTFIEENGANSMVARFQSRAQAKTARGTLRGSARGNGQ